jgi:hypothetical protein
MDTSCTPHSLLRHMVARYSNFLHNFTKLDLVHGNTLAFTASGAMSRMFPFDLRIANIYEEGFES